MNWPLAHWTMVNGPVPIIAVLSNVPVSLLDTFDQMCCGRIGTASWFIAGSGAFMVNTTVDGSGDATLLMFCTELRYWAFAVESLRSRLNVYTTSCAVNGSPSDHFTPWRIVKVHVRPSAEWVHF